MYVLFNFYMLHFIRNTRTLLCLDEQYNYFAGSFTTTFFLFGIIILLLPYNHSCMQLSGAVLYFFMALHGHSITDISKFVQDSTKFCSPHTILLRYIACATLIFPASCIEIA